MTTARRTSGRTRKTRAQLQEEVDELRAVLEGRAVDGAKLAQLGLPLAAASDVDRIMGELGAGAGSVTLWRTRRDGRPEYVRTFELGEWSLEAVRDEYGAGAYLAKFFDEDQQGIGERQFHVAEQKASAVTADQLAVNLAALERERRAQHVPPAEYSRPGRDPMDIYIALAQASTENTKAMMAILAPLLTPKDDSLTREILLTLLKREPQGTESFFEMFEKARELMGDRGDYSDVVRELGRPLAALMAKGAESKNGGAPKNGADPSRQLPNPESSSAESAERPTLRIGSETPFLILRPHMGRLLRLASQGANVKLWAPALEVEFERHIDLLASVIDAVGPDGAVEALVETFPDAEPYREWFGQLLAELLARLELEPESGDDSPE